MGYNIEISFNMLKHANVSELKKMITDFALDCCCDHYYYLYELEGKCKLPRNHCIIVVNFEDDEIFNCSTFVKKVRKMKDLYIECIYEDEIRCKLIYASQYYLTTMDKDKVVKYNKFKRERSLSDNEKLILDQITNPTKK
jgi:hypothetical protein